MSVVKFKLIKGFGCAGQLSKVPISQTFLKRFASTKNEIQETVIVTATVENVLSDKEVEKICNKSRLNSGHRNLVNGRLPYDHPVHRFHNTVKFKRRMYGRYGDASNIHPGLAWPTVEELNDIREYESVAYPLTIQEMQHNAIKRLQCEQQEIQMRQQKIDNNMKKLNSWINEVKEKSEKKIYEAQKSKEKRENLIEEVKKHFGYKIDPKDERFKEMLAKREKEEKKKVREEKKKIREEKLVNYLKNNE
ncbi:Growth arrest/ DNA-damage-inducible protein-interacting protein 1 [Cinara cedri]|uniref:Large ribosomal subunit protein mL64 n=1 Tax=Cinara cedri TaxID=506608 RepID=A0A5E4MAB4_9HEMI|nr:Growth arrest/ DNA-damage-inducible protein-interacting protein 1 [Cinara cedri]